MKIIFGFNVPISEKEDKSKQTFKRQSFNAGFGFAFSKSDFFKFKGMPGNVIKEIEDENKKGGNK
jgi:hypothetical protein